MRWEDDNDNDDDDYDDDNYDDACEDNDDHGDHRCGRWSSSMRTLSWM